MSEKIMCNHPGCGAGPFKGQLGLHIHQKRTKGHPGYTRSWNSKSSTSKNSKSNSNSKSKVFPLTQTIISILSNHPNGMSLREITEAVNAAGYRKPTNIATRRVCAALVNNEAIKKVGKKGTRTYKLLKRMPHSVASSSKTKRVMIDEPVISRDALEIQLARTTKTNRTLRSIVDQLLNITV